MKQKEHEQKVKEFISETSDQILQKENDINDTRIDYYKKKSLSNTRFGIIVSASMIVFIFGVYFMNWYCIVGAVMISFLSYLYIEDIKLKNLKLITETIKSLYKDLHDLQKKLARAKKGWLPCEHQIHGEVTSM